MQTVEAFYVETRRRFPDLAERADREHVRLWGEVDIAFAYSWFGSLANSLCALMQRHQLLERCSELFNYVDVQFELGSDEVRNCIDVSLVENLFWQVPGELAHPYWNRLPQQLKGLYLGFHARPPI